MSPKQKAIEKWWKENPHRRCLMDPNCVSITRASAELYMDIGFRCGWDAALKRAAEICELRCVANKDELQSNESLACARAIEAELTK